MTVQIQFMHLSSYERFEGVRFLEYKGAFVILNMDYQTLAFSAYQIHRIEILPSVQAGKQNRGV